MKIAHKHTFDAYLERDRHYLGENGEPIPEVNIPLLRKAVDWALDEAKKPMTERRWDQNWWMRKTECGTACCIAGFVTEVQGYQPWWESPYESTSSDVIVIGDIWDRFDTEILRESIESIPDVARKELGLLPTEADCLFDGDNTVENIRQYAEWIAERAGERL